MDHYIIPADATVDIPQSTNKVEQLFELELKKKQNKISRLAKIKVVTIFSLAIDVPSSHVCSLQVLNWITYHNVNMRELCTIYTHSYSGLC